MFSSTMYVRISRNQFRAREVESGKETTVLAPAPFTSTRLLVGDFNAAQHALRLAFKELGSGRLFMPSPRVVMHPLEMVEGGLSQIEERTLMELAMGAGAAKAVVWVGGELGDDEVKEKSRAK